MVLIVSLGYGGTGMPHINMMPCPAPERRIALQGVFPPRL
jgi:microcystin-dependent protein